ncbi:MAG: hypothetical protein JWQ01_756, partial [Massilia sp.]|nr:hypothetical protein [Massilia sp.]
RPGSDLGLTPILLILNPRPGSDLGLTPILAQQFHKRGQTRFPGYFCSRTGIGALHRSM